MFKLAPAWQRLRPRLWRWGHNFLLGYLVFILLGLLLFRWVPVYATPLMVWRLVNGYGWHQQWTPLAKLPRHAARAAVASEDGRFCEHNGVDWLAVQKVWDEWQRGEGLRGASTIPMQVARNVFLWPGQDPLRKLLEIPLTYAIEFAWGKRRIMEVYLNIAEWGPGTYGLAAAAKLHYKKTPNRLTAQQINYLVALLPAPLYWDPRDMPISVLIRAESLSARAARNGPLRCLR